MLDKIRQSEQSAKELHAQLTTMAHGLQAMKKRRVEINEMLTFLASREVALTKFLSDVLVPTREQMFGKNLALFEGIANAFLQEVFYAGQTEIKSEYSAIQLMIDEKTSSTSKQPHLLIKMEGRDPETGATWPESAERQGGSGTDVLSMAFQIASVLMSGERKVIFVDEPDSQCAAQNILPFYSCLARACEARGLQIVCVTHHYDQLLVNNESLHPDLGESVTVIRCTRDGKTRHLNTERVFDGAEWRSDHEGVRTLVSENFGPFSSASFEFGPGLNIITAPNRTGKSFSTTLPMLGLITGAIAPLDIHRGGPRARISATMLGPSGAIEEFSLIRNAKKRGEDPLQKYEHTFQTNGVIHREQFPKVGVPESVTRALNIRPPKAGHISPHLRLQKVGSFFIHEEPSKRATMLNIGDQIVFVMDKIQRTKKILKSDEKLKDSLSAELVAMEKLDAISSRIEKLTEILREIIDDVEKDRLQAQKAEEIDRLLIFIHDLSNFLESSAPIMSGVKTLSERKLPLDRLDVIPVITNHVDFLECLDRSPIKTSAADLQSLQESIALSRPRESDVADMIRARNIESLIDLLQILPAASVSGESRSVIYDATSMQITSQDILNLDRIDDAVNIFSAMESAFKRPQQHQEHLRAISELSKKKLPSLAPEDELINRLLGELQSLDIQNASIQKSLFSLRSAVERVQAVANHEVVDVDAIQLALDQLSAIDSQADLLLDCAQTDKARDAYISNMLHQIEHQHAEECPLCGQSASQLANPEAFRRIRSSKFTEVSHEIRNDCSV